MLYLRAFCKVVAVLTLTAFFTSNALAGAPGPSVTEDPVSQTVDLGGTVTFTGAGTGAGTLTYKWYLFDTELSNGTVGGVVTAGATTASITLTNVSFASAGAYTLKITDDNGSATTDEAILTVQKRPGAFAGSQPEFNGEVKAIAFLPDGSYLVGGAFQSVTINSVVTQRDRLVHILANGTAATDAPTVNGTVNAIEVDTAGRVFVGGNFTANGAQGSAFTRTRVLRLTSTLALDTAFDTSTSAPNDEVLTLAPTGDGSVYIGGEFNAIGADTSRDRRAIAKLKANGTLDTSFKSQAYPSGAYVTTILRLPNGTLYVGGSINYWKPTDSIPTPFESFARTLKLSATGGRDTKFASPSIFVIPSQIIKLQDGSLLVGANSGGQDYLHRVNAGTGADITVMDGLAHASAVNAVAQQADGKLLSGALGTFFRTSLAGVEDPDFTISPSFNSKINVIKVASDGRIFVGGSFSSVSGPPKRFAILNGGALDSRNGLLPPQTITFNELDDRVFTPGANSFMVSATASSELPVSFEITGGGPATVNGNTVTISGVGDVTVKATQAGSAEFSAAPAVSRTFTVSKGTQTINFAPLVDRSSLSPDFPLTATASSGLTVSFEVVEGPATITGGNTLVLDDAPGTVVVRATQAGNATIDAALPVVQSFEATAGPVVQGPQTITFAQPTNRYVGESLLLEATASSGLPVTVTATAIGTAGFSRTGDTLTLTSAGKITLEATQAGNANFSAAVKVTRTLTVLAAPTGLTLTNLVQTYNGTPRPIGFTGVSLGTDVSITYAGSSTPPTKAGKYAVVAKAGSVTKAGSLTINKATATITADNLRKIAGQANPALTLTYGGLLGSDTSSSIFVDPTAVPAVKAPAVTTTAKVESVGGIYPIKVTGAVAVNYSFVYVNGTLTVDSFAGQYEALLAADGDPRPIAKVEFTVVASGKTFSGKITTPREKSVIAITGALGTPNFGLETCAGTGSKTVGASKYTVNFTVPLMGPVIVELLLNDAPLASTLTGQKLLVLAKGQTLSYMGAHTMVLAPGVPVVVTADPIPAGAGHATATIDAKGIMKIAAKLADGTALTASLPVDAQAGYRLFALPYKRVHSYIAGQISLTDHPDLPGRKHVSYASDTNLVWTKYEADADKAYRGGFDLLETRVTLDPWLPPAKAVGSTPAITLANRLGLAVDGEMTVFHSTIVSDDYDKLPVTVKLDAAGKVSVLLPETTPANSTKWKVTLTPTTGAFTGSFVLTGAKVRTVPFTGVLRQPPSTDTEGVVGGGNFQLPALPAEVPAQIKSGEIQFQLPAP